MLRTAMLNLRDSLLQTQFSLCDRYIEEKTLCNVPVFPFLLFRLMLFLDELIGLLTPISFEERLRRLQFLMEGFDSDVPF